jgi:DNA-binding LacI/PurR family transcriptional regulator
VHEVLWGRNYGILLYQSNGDPKTEYEQIRQAAGRRVDGLLMIACRDSAAAGHFEELEIRKIPAVLMSRPVRAVPFDIFTGADERDGYRLTKRLLELGHRKIAHILVESDMPTEGLRSEGWRKAMKEAGLKSERWEIRIQGWDIEETRSAAEKSLKSSDPPTAFFVPVEMLASGVLLAMKDLGLEPGQDISVATFFSGHPVSMARILPPRLGGIIGPSLEIGKRSARRLLELIEEGPERKIKPAVTELPGEWFEGGSIGPVGRKKGKT